MKHASKLSVAILSLATLVSCANAPSFREISQQKPTSLTVIATTDFHGEFDGQEGQTSDGLTMTIGGATYYASYLKTLRENTAGPVVWIDAGDLFQGSMASNLFEGAPVVRLMNHLGLQAVALGNHEFDYGPVGPKAVQRTPKDDPRGALKARIHESHFPTLAANVLTTKGKIPDWLKASTVLEVQGLRIGVVGGASPGTPGTTNALNLVGLKFLPLMPSIQQEAERLRREELVDFVIVTVHEGGSCDNNAIDAQDDVTSCPDAPILALAKQLPAGLVNMIVAGHTHKGVAKRINGTVVLQPFSHGKYIGWATLPVGGGQGEIKGLQPVCAQVVNTPKGPSCDPFQIKLSKGPATPAVFFGKTMEPDAEAAAILAPELSKVKELKESPLGFQALDPLNRAFLGESALGNLTADVSKEAIPNMDLGLSNGGGLRANIGAGPVTYGDIFGLMPFDNQAAIMKVPGDKLTELVKVGLFGNVGTYSWSSNLGLIADGCELKELKVNGQDVDPAKTYLVATSDFLAGGGSGVSQINLPKENVEILWDHDNILRELTVNVLKKWHKDIRSTDYFSADAPRQKILKKCERAPQ